MKQEAIMKSYYLNGKMYSVSDNEIFNSISKAPIYEVVRVVNGKALFLKEHIERMLNSAKLLNYKLPLTEQEIKEAISNVILENEIVNNNIKLLAVDVDENPYFLIYAIESFYPPKEMYDKGIKTILYKHTRENPNAKVAKLGFKEAVAAEIKKENAFEALLVNDEGSILEGSRSNLFYVIGGTLYTAPADKVLLGITREHILKVAKDKGIEVKERALKITDLDRLDGLFISGTSIGVLPVSYIDDLKLRSVDNETIKKMLKGYNSLTNSLSEGIK